MSSNYFWKTESTSFVNDNGKIRAKKVLIEDNGKDKRVKKIDQKGKNVLIQDKQYKDGKIVKKDKRTMSLEDPEEKFEFIFANINDDHDSSMQRIPIAPRDNTSNRNRKPDYKMRPHDSQIKK